MTRYASFLGGRSIDALLSTPLNDVDTLLTNYTSGAEMCAMCTATIWDMGCLSFIFETRHDDAGDIGWPQMRKDALPNKIRHGKHLRTMVMSRAFYALCTLEYPVLNALVLRPHGWKTSYHDSANRSIVPL